MGDLLPFWISATLPQNKKRSHKKAQKAQNVYNGVLDAIPTFGGLGGVSNRRNPFDSGVRK